MITPVTCQLPYRAPYEWNALLAILRMHQLPHLEQVDDTAYERVVLLSSGLAWFRVTRHAGRKSLLLSLSNGSESDLAQISSHVRRMFDLDADPAVIRQAMTADPFLAEAWNHHPGLRVARFWSGFETMVTTILGQVVSVAFARTLVDELMQAAGAKAIHPKTGEPIHLFPTAESLLAADLSSVRTSASRRATIRGLAALIAGGSLNVDNAPSHELRRLLLTVPGIGPWSAEYIAMRGFKDDDAFPATDYALKQELKSHPEMNVNRVRPWRAYAAATLWKNYVERKAVPHEPVL